MPYVGASVDESTKEKWQSHLEESHHGSMSELVRAAVRKEVRREESQEGGREVNIELDAVEERQETVIDRLESLSQQVQEVSEKAQEEQTPEEIQSLAHEIGSDLQEMSQEAFRTEFEAEVAQAYGDMAVEYLGEPEEGQKVRAALQYLEENVPWIRRRPTPPNEYYRVRD